MLNLIKSLRLVLSKSDFDQLLLMSLALTLVALIEVGGLAAIAFLVLNLENLNGALLDVEFIVLLLNLLRLSEDKVLFLFAGLIISYSFLTIVISTISIRRISLFSEIMGARIKTSLMKHFLSLEWLDFLKSHSSKDISRIIHDGDIVADMINFFMNLFNKFILALVITSALFIFNPSLTFGLTLILSAAYLLIFAAFK